MVNYYKTNRVVKLFSFRSFSMIKNSLAETEKHLLKSWGFFLQVEKTFKQFLKLCVCLLTSVSPNQNQVCCVVGHPWTQITNLHLRFPTCLWRRDRAKSDEWDHTHIPTSLIVTGVRTHVQPQEAASIIHGCVCSRDCWGGRHHDTKAFLFFFSTPPPPTSSPLMEHLSRSLCIFFPSCWLMRS